MNKISPYARFSPKDFDKYNCVNISFGFYVMLAFILRGYLVWIMSVTNLQDKVGFLAWIYPEKPLFYLSLFSGGIGWFIVLLLSLRRPDAPLWVKKFWGRCHWILIGALIFDFVCTFLGFILAHKITSSTVITHTIIVLVCIIYIIKNQRFKLNLREFPEHF